LIEAAGANDYLHLEFIKAIEVPIAITLVYPPVDVLCNPTPEKGSAWFITRSG